MPTEYDQQRLLTLVDEMLDKPQRPYSPQKYVVGTLCH
jgi:hypothetical protein